MTAPSPLRVGLISFAHPHAVAYARILASSSGVDLVCTDTGAVDAGTQRGEALATALGVRYLPDVATLLAEGPDAVIVAAENADHRHLVEQAVSAGAHVLCEKPLATTDADATAMVAAARVAGVWLMTAYPVRFSAEFRELAARVRDGQLGQIISIHATNNGKMPLAQRSWFTDPARSGGGALVDHVVHAADLIDEILREPAEQVHAVTNTILRADADRPVETGAAVSIGYPSGAIAQIDSSWSQPESAPQWGGLTLEVHGTDGSMRIDPYSNRIDGYHAAGALWQSFGANLDAALLDEFLDAIRTGRRPQPDGETGARTLAIVTAAQRSAATGKVVEVGIGSESPPI